MKPIAHFRKIASASLVAILVACQTSGVGSLLPSGFARQADDLVVVDCLLPGQVRQLGREAMYVTARRPVKATIRDCAGAGGEFVLFDSANPTHALAMWEPRAEGGDPEAQTYAGELYERADQPDYAKAADWYRKAAAQDDARAMINLANLYEKGLGVQKSPAEAARWYAKAAGVEVQIDPFTIQNQQARIEQLERQVNRLKLQLKDRQSRVDRQSKAVKAEKKAVQQERIIFVRESERVDVLPPELEATGKALDAREKKLEGDESALLRLNEELQKAKQDSSRLRSDLAAAQNDANKRPEVAHTASLAGPTIELIDPPLLATRGLRVAVRSATRMREVIGRVTAPAGLLSLKINGARTPVNETGVFRSDVTLTQQRTPVAILAVDKRGQRAALSITLERPIDASTPPPALPEPKTAQSYSGVEFGNYHALIIGNDDYTGLSDLRTAVNDARAIDKVLREKYGFRTTVIENATRFQLLSALNTLREKLTNEDNLLVYYAGHGELDTVNMRGHWLPVDAEENNTANWISNVSITDTLNTIAAKQILLVVDACYSGALTRSGVPRLQTGKTERQRLNWLKTVSQRRSRTVLTSGGLKPVMDVGGGKHSVFARALLEVLHANSDVLEGHRLYREVSARVAYAASKASFDQVPEYAPIQHAGHEAGDFLLIPQG